MRAPRMATPRRRGCPLGAGFAGQARPPIVPGVPRRRRGFRLSAGAVALLLWAAPPADSPVADAAMRGDAEAVVALIGQGADVNVPQGDGMTALHWAAERADAALVRTLLDAGADVTAVTRIGDYSPLHLAGKAGSGDAVKALLEAGSDPHAVTATGAVTAMHFAAGAGSADAIATLARHGAAVDAREADRGQTPLMFAAANDRMDALQALLALGADLTLRTRVVDIVDLAAIDREAGEARDAVLEEFRAQAEDPRSWRPTPEQVQAAVRAGHEVQASRTRALADQEEPEAAPDAFPGYTGLVGRQGGMTALLHAVREGHAETALALLDAGADINGVSGGDHTGPLLMATINGHFDLAMTLLGRGADPRTASDAGATPLYATINAYWVPKSRYPQQQAYQQQHTTYLELMEALLEAGADPNARLTRHLWYMSYTFDLLRVDTQGATPFWRAAYGTDVEAMKLLVANGADPSIPTMKPPERRRGGADAEDPSGLPPVPVGGPGVYPIHAASGVGYGEGYAGNSHRHAPNGWLPSVRYLVEELGVDVNARDHNGYNALHHAAARGDVELIRYLAERGADVTAVSRRGQTTADMANGPVQRIQPFPEALALLESLGAHNNDNCLSC
ncbi:MAG: ankyrin repeat domain-containing protein [Gammaproteobacteria bacterium]|nr:ankyrin repeat domain-containing protein [Gammaproteobacteria bacterium]